METLSHNEEPPLTQEELRLVRRSIKFFRTDSPLKDPDFKRIQRYLQLQEKQDKPGTLRRWGVRLQRWSMEKPTLKEETLKRLVYTGIIGGLTLFAYTELSHTLQSAADVTFRAEDLVKSLASFNLHQLDPVPLKPDIDFSSLRQFPPDFGGVKIALPNPGAAFDPMFTEHQAQVDLAKEALKLQISQTINYGIITGISGLAALTTVMVRHPFKSINERSSFVFPVLGRAMEWVGDRLG